MKMHMLALDVDSGDYRSWCGAAQKPHLTSQPNEITCKRCLRFWTRKKKP